MGELREINTPSQTIAYQHNALNQRTAKLINGQVVEKYLWANLTTLLAIYDANDNLVQRFEYADQRMPVSMSTSGMKYYLHYDQVGSLRAVSDTSGQIVKEIVYDTFGTIVSDSNPDFNVPFGFAGGLYDNDTKLTRFGYRDYDAYTGKWTAKDPIGFDGGDSNLYGYVLGDPVNFVDPKGLSKIFSMADDTGKIKATIEGALSIEEKFNRCMKRAERVCPSDFVAQ
jgi:RHS repeat-associated protein